MPMYSYKCSKCGHKRDVFREVGVRNTGVACPACTHCMARDRVSEHVSTEKDYDNHYSESMGVHANQVAEHRRVHPDIPMTDDGRVIIRNKAEGRRIRKKLGFFDRDGYSH